MCADALHDQAGFPPEVVVRLLSDSSLSED